MKVGDIVILQEANTMRNDWQMCRVMHIQYNIGFVTMKFNISITCSKISLQELPFEIGTTTNHFHVVAMIAYC